MKRPLILAALVLLTAAVPALAHEHKVLGTVTMTASDHVMMKTVDGKDVTVTLTKTTKVTMGKETVKPDAIKDGARIVVTTASDESPYTAMLIQVGAAAPAKAGQVRKK